MPLQVAAVNNFPGNAAIVTEKNYPITTLWLFKGVLIILGISIVLLIFGYVAPKLIILMVISLIANPLIRKNFHYALNDKYFYVKQGVFSKKERNLPYGVIQNVFVKQDLFDRIFGLASLRVENASQAGGGNKEHWWNKSYGSKSTVYGQQEGIGAYGNAVNIPGLKKSNAEELKGLVLQKMKENPIEDSQSGL